MSRPERLEKTRKAYAAVCDLVQSPVISNETRIYLAQLREVLHAEITEMQNETKESASA